VLTAGVPVGCAGDFVPAELAASLILVAAPATETLFGQPMIAGDVYAIAGNGADVQLLASDGALATATQSPASEPTSPGLGGECAPRRGSQRRVGRRRADRRLLRQADDRWAPVLDRGRPAQWRPARSRGEGLLARVLPGGADRAGNLIVGCNRGGLQVLAGRGGRFYGHRMRAGHVYPLTGITGTSQIGIPASQTALWPKAVSVARSRNPIILDHSDQEHVRMIATGLAHGQHVRAHSGNGRDPHREPQRTTNHSPGLDFQPNRRPGVGGPWR
jgi:hypothetical protein